MMLNFLFILGLVSSSFAQTGKPCLPAADQFSDIRKLNENSCEAVRDSKECTDFYKKIDKESDTSSKILVCDASARERIAASYIGCLTGGWDASFGSLVDGVKNFSRNSKAQMDRLKRCDASREQKKSIFRTYNLNLPRVLQIPEPSNEKLERLSCAELEVSLNRLQNYQYQKFLQNHLRRLAVPFDQLTPDEKEYYDWARQNALAGTSSTSLAGFADELLEEYGIRTKCYNAAAIAALRCEIIFQAVTATLAIGKVAIVGLAGLKTARVIEAADSLNVVNTESKIIKASALEESGPVNIPGPTAVAKTESRASAVELPNFSHEDYEAIEKSAFHSAETNLFSIPRGTAEAAQAKNAEVVNNLNSWPRSTDTKRLSGLNENQLNDLYSKVAENKVSSLCSVSKYDPAGGKGFCFGRATTAHLEALRAGIDKNQVRKVWAVGNFKTSLGRWRYHVATIVRASDGKWMAIDPIVGKPITLEEWYKKMAGYESTHDMRLLTTTADRYGPSTTSKYSPKEFQKSTYNDYFNDLMKNFRDEIRGSPPNSL